MSRASHTGTNPEDPNPRGPNFLLVGGARCGTTGLVEGLRAHPDVFVTEPKEPHYFAFSKTGVQFTAPGDNHTINKVAVTDRDAYLALYPAQHSYRALGDGSVSTMYHYREALPEALAMNPTMKFVALLREPVDRAYSAHQYMRARGFEPVEDFLEAVALESERREAGWHHIWHYASMSRYADAVAAFQDAVPPEQLGIWFYDELNQDYAGTLAEVVRFLGATPSTGSSGEVPRVNVSGQAKHKSVQAAIGWATSNATVRTTVKKMTSHGLRERVRGRVLRSDGLPPGIRKQLQPLFAEDLARLRTLLPSGGPDWLQHGEAAR